MTDVMITQFSEKLNQKVFRAFEKSSKLEENNFKLWEPLLSHSFEYASIVFYAVFSRGSRLE